MTDERDLHPNDVLRVLTPLKAKDGHLSIRYWVGLPVELSFKGEHNLSFRTEEATLRECVQKLAKSAETSTAWTGALGEAIRSLDDPYVPPSPWWRRWL